LAARRRTSQCMTRVPRKTTCLPKRQRQCLFIGPTRRAYGRMNDRGMRNRQPAWLPWPLRGAANHPGGHTGTQGFTLIEPLVVLVIPGLLAAFAAPQVLNYLGRAKTDTARAQVQNIASILDLYRLEVGSYPSQRDGLEALLEQPADAQRWNGPSRCST